MDVQKNVVLAVDGSKHAEIALEFYLRELWKEQHVVHLVQAMEHPYSNSGADPVYDVNAQEVKTVKDAGKETLDKCVKKLEESQVRYEVHANFAQPGAYICKVAKDSEATMIVIGSRGHGRIRRTILGSVSDYVIHHAHCPILVARH